MGKSIKEVGVGFCCYWVVNVGCLFGRLDVARLQPEPSVAHALMHTNIFCRTVAVTSLLLMWLYLLVQ